MYTRNGSVSTGNRTDKYETIGTSIVAAVWNTVNLTANGRNVQRLSIGAAGCYRGVTRDKINVRGGQAAGSADTEKGFTTRENVKEETVIRDGAVFVFKNGTQPPAYLKRHYVYSYVL